MESSLYSELHKGSEKMFHRDILREVIDSVHHFIREKFQMKPVFIFNDGMSFNDEGFIYWENIKFSAMRNGEPYTIEIDFLSVNTMLNIASGGRHGFIMESWSEKKDSVETVAHHLGKNGLGEKTILNTLVLMKSTNREKLFLFVKLHCGITVKDSAVLPM